MLRCSFLYVKTLKQSHWLLMINIKIQFNLNVKTEIMINLLYHEPSFSVVNKLHFNFSLFISDISTGTNALFETANYYK